MNWRLQSYNQQILVRLVWVVSVALGLTTFEVTAADWGEHLILHEESRSPDGHYGIVVTTSSHVDDGKTFLIPEDDEEFVDYFADLKTHRLLGKIKHFAYVEGENHGHLDAQWAPDSDLCIATDWSRYGFANAVVLEPKGESFAQADIGQRIQKSIDAVIAKQSHHANDTGDVSPIFRVEPDRKIRVYADGRTNPKSLEGVKTYYALFQGRYDLRSKKWIASAAHALSSKEAEMLDRASTEYSDEQLTIAPEAFKDLTADAEEPLISDGKTLFRSEETKFKYLDDHLNDVYKAIRLLLPPAEFAKIKQEQIAWVKKRDASNSVAERSKLTEERSETLQKLVWVENKSEEQ
jgi:uncharacterized protein YecT (DUF1311 family)